MPSGSSRNARITLVIAGLNGGGAERVCVNLANEWVARGRPVTIQTVFRKSRAPAYTIDSRVELRDVGWPRGATLAELNMPAIAAIMRGVQTPHCSVLLAEITLIGLMRHAILATNAAQCAIGVAPPLSAGPSLFVVAMSAMPPTAK